jgi:hypothetical protein
MLEGDFTEEDLKELAQWVRGKEMRDPKKLFLIFLDKKSTLSMPEGFKLIKELMVASMEKKFGKFKKIVVNGVAYRVPTKDIVLNGVAGAEIPKKYPKWEDEK